MRSPVAAAVGLLGLSLAPEGAEAACGNISIAEMNWGSAAIAAHVDKIVLERGFGCTVTLVPGDTVPTFTSMNTTGSPDLAPEFWVNAVRADLARATSQNRLVVGAEILADGAVEGWWVPKFVVDANPDIRTVEDALARPDLFPAPGNEDKGALHSCPADWSCQVTTANLFRAFGAGDLGFDLIEAETPKDLEASIAAAFDTGTGWLGYYWAPTAILGKYPMVKLSFGVTHDKSEWNECTTVSNCPNPEPNAYPTSQAFTLLTQGFREKAADTMDYVNRRQWTNATVSSLLAWQLENGASNRDTAEHFISEHREVWAAWVSPAVAERIEAVR